MPSDTLQATSAITCKFGIPLLHLFNTKTQMLAMKAIEILNRLEQMDQLIRLKATGNPRAFASRLGISQSMMYNYLEMLRSIGGPVQYNKVAVSYEYEYRVALKIGYEKK